MKWNIPVTIVMCDEVEVSAPTLREAIKKCKEDKLFSRSFANISIGDYRVDADEDYIMKYFNNDKIDDEIEDSFTKSPFDSGDELVEEFERMFL